MVHDGADAHRGQFISVVAFAVTEASQAVTTRYLDFTMQYTLHPRRSSQNIIYGTKPKAILKNISEGKQ